MALLSTKIREIIKEKGISAHALEKMAGLKPSAIQNILYGRSKNPSLATLSAIAQTLGCTLSSLIEDAGISPEDGKSCFEAQGNLGKIWNQGLYLDAIEIVINIIRKSAKEINRGKLLYLVDEVYLYSLNHDGKVVDHYFAQWLFEHSGYI